MQNLDLKIEIWKKRLLDIDKSNKLINFKETKKSNLTITTPDLSNLYNSLVVEEKSLSFSHPLKTIIDENGEEVSVSIVKGDIVTNKILNEQQKILKLLRAKSKISIEEQGINTLYLTFGMLLWNDLNNNEKISSPVILVPVDLTQVSINEPYYLNLHNDEIILNPSLSYKFENDYSIKLPSFDEREDGIKEYLQKIKLAVHKYSKNDWQVKEEVHLSLLSFLKINMYDDMDKNKDKIIVHPIIKALAGDLSQIKKAPKELNFYDHDKNERPIDSFQVLDADSSQQDAILLAKNDISFVLQGPPGTGKSQTITNIISESLAQGKKVLFVSEKMAALEVVKKRLVESGLNDFCLTLHSQKANKKEILNELKNIIKLPKEKINEEILYKLSELEEKRNILNDYQEELHTKISPLNASIYEINGKLANLVNTEDLLFSFNDDIENINYEKLNKYKFLINEYIKTVGRMSILLTDNPWYKSNINTLTLDLRNHIEINLNRLLQSFESFIDLYQDIASEIGIKFDYSVFNAEIIIDILSLTANSQKISKTWLKTDVYELLSKAKIYQGMCDEYLNIKDNLNHRYSKKVFKLSYEEITSYIEKEIKIVKLHINLKNYNSNKDILLNAENIIDECEEIKTHLNDIMSLSTNICDILGLDELKTSDDLVKLNELISLLTQNPLPTDRWFNDVQINDVMKILNDGSERQLSLKNKVLNITKNFEKQIIKENHNELLKRLSLNYEDILNLIANKYNINEIKNVDKKSIYEFINNDIKELNGKKVILENAFISASKIAEMFELEEIKNFENLISLGKLLNLINESPRPVAAWFDSYKDSIIDKLISDIKNKLNQTEKMSNIILTKYNKDIFDVDHKGILSRFNLEYVGFKKHIKSSYKVDRKTIIACSKDQNIKLTDEEIVILLNDISVVKDNKQWLEDQDQLIKISLEHLYNGQFTNWELIEKSRENFKDLKKHFINYQIPDNLKLILLENNFNSIKDHFINLNEITLKVTINAISEIIGNDLQKVEITEILNKINYILKSSNELKNDIDIINKYKINNFNNDKFEDLIDLLNVIAEVKDIQNWFKNNNYLLQIYLGNNFNGENTDFDKINNSIDTVNKIKNILNYDVSEKLKQTLIDGNINKHKNEFELYRKKFDNVKKLNLIEKLSLILNKDKLNNLNLKEITNYVDVIINALNNSLKKYMEFSRLLNAEFPFETIMSDLEFLGKLQNIEQFFMKNEKTLKTQYDIYYDGINSKWDNLINALEFTLNFNEILNKYQLSDKFIDEVLNDSKIQRKCRDYLDEFNNVKRMIDSDFKWFSDLFEDNESLYLQNINKIYDKIENCLNISLLEEYIDYKRVKNELVNIGLEQFIDKCENSRITGECILNSFLKRFYKLWLDIELNKFPNLYNFRGLKHQAVVDEFIELDKLQFEIAKLRIREMLISKIPDYDVATSSEDEIGILKRELSKQKKSMSLRNIFNAIPNLLTTLKPCLMMSPLSVSLYLNSDLYNFDVVIFDEASQVCTEEAVGTIIRGKQVIIAGDRYQLPPTNFFSSSYIDNSLYSNEDDFEKDEEYYDDIDSYDSILDEASNAILERTLKWHYRSRNENLIAFSNERIYKNELTTFPSYKTSSQDFGVEYIYVENGIYDRGGKKNNVLEARKVADTVFEHFDLFPNRSLGVVTFSFAQQQAVENAIRQKRLSNPTYEHFFYEDKEEPFFVKNLENVQGDERDTIIISIGYAKDLNGLMYMNFGPLSYSGGYRRLNVAITRAKFNVKLIGSITPDDINLEKTNAEGVLMLRQYIDYAMNTQSYLENKNSVNTTLFKSPFEEAVYNFLIENGYTVETQVGFSEYRIDMAVKHPKLNGLFVLGVECDGHTYHKAKTVRERDRLRKSVLNDMGWNTYRIWSREWVNNYKSESDKLLIAVKNAVDNYKI
ncbi:MAG: helicase related protein [Bacillota bacterium]|nr:helicase related protein [Bacillota bacterium]